ncbi:gem-associated protein 4 [Salminus brasiliensis]|uniref:gem-associated protein 4 n=1 Tax=Salminus brasiliensis TaxID=930266 RepID=UPI003B82DDDD
MDQESWLSCEKTAVLQGGFLLANQLCQPAPLSALRKEDWERVGRPIVQAVTEICGQLCGDNQDQLNWKKRILCIVWSKILEVGTGEDVDVKWKENPLFPVQNSLPDINHAVMFELVKSMGFFSIYVELLQCFQAAEQWRELERLAKHVTSDSTEEDVKFLLEVWWELMKGRREELDNLDQIFTTQCIRFEQSPSDCSPQASKRFKPDPESAASTTCIFSLLFQTLNSMKECITCPELCYFALSNCLDMLYTSHLLDRAVELPVEAKLQIIARSVSLRKTNCLLEAVELTQAISEAQRDLAATLTPAQNKPSGMTILQAMQVILGLICSWEAKGLLTMPSCEPSGLAIRLKDSIRRVFETLEQMSEGLDGNGETLNSLRKALTDLLASSSITVSESSSTDLASVAMAILDSNLKGFQDLPKLYASKLSQAFNETEWLNCLERNKSVFQQKDLVMTLVSTLIAKSQGDTDVKQSTKLKDVIMDIFSQLLLPDKNAALSEILKLSKKGLHGFLPSSVTLGYDKELNLAFNSIIQGGAKSSLSSAVSAVARVAFQNPEAALCRCCHMAVVNLGAHTLLAQILQQLPGLRSSPEVPKELRNKEQNLLCRCLHATVWNKFSSAQEEDQFLHFLSALMEPSIIDQTEEKLCFVPPEEAVCAFVLPYFSSSTSSSSSVELCLRLLQCALTHISSGDATSWIMNCSPFPLLYCLAQLLNNCSRCWEQPLEGDTVLSIESKELLVSILTMLGKAVGKEVELAPSTWSRALSWLYGKVEEFDWTVRFYLKEVWGQHFKNEVPSSLMAVCELSEQEWSGLVLPHYGQGTGLLAWVECCCISDHVQATMQDSLSLNLLNPEEVNMFSKGLMVAVLQTLPWSTVGEWERLVKVLRELLHSDKLYVPYSLEYVDFLPLLDLRSFACDLRLSVFLLRLFQLLCGSSCADWLPPQGWAHVSRLYASAMRQAIDSVKGKVPLPSTATLSKSPEAINGVLSQEVLFVLTQLFCHVLHVQVMMPGQSEPLFLCALEILSSYEAVLAAYPKSSTALQRANTRHFLTTISDNVQCTDTRAVLHQKIAQL